MRGWLLALAVLAAGLTASPGLADGEGPHEVHVVAHEDPAACVADEAPCYEIVDDGWSLVSGGDRLAITFENNASTDHALNLAAGENASDEEDTDPAAAFASLGPIAPGAREEATVEIPRGTDTAYLFCHLDDHEERGLHLLRNVYPAGSVEQARERGPGLDEPHETAGPAGLIALALGAFVGRRR